MTFLEVAPGTLAQLHSYTVTQLHSYKVYLVCPGKAAGRRGKTGVSTNSLQAQCLHRSLFQSLLRFQMTYTGVVFSLISGFLKIVLTQELILVLNWVL